MTIDSARLTGLVVACVWSLLVTLCVWAYLPGLDGPSMLDDGVNLQGVEILGEHPEFLSDVVFNNYSGPLGRPLSMLSFSLEKVTIDAGLRGSKSLNLLLHVFIATLLLFFTKDIFRHIGYERPWSAALMVASLWLMAPFLLSTVLYVVQRIAQLATLLSLLALWSYLRARVAVGAGRIAWAALCLLATVSAPFAKENGLLVLPLLCLLEWQLLNFSRLGPVSSRYMKGFCAALLTAGLLGFMLVVILQPEIITSAYEARNFNLNERLLTQGRVLWQYLGQLWWTDTALLGLYQDGYPLSATVFQPVSTLWALLGWLMLAGAWSYCAWRGRLVGLVFGLGVFVLAHAMESSFFPLELYFEHRNYLPAMGFFIALVSLGVAITSRWNWMAHWLTVAYLVLLGHSWQVLVQEAEIWSNASTLHLSQINRFPDSPRANIEIARLYASAGELELALSYSRRAHDIEGSYDLSRQLMDLNLQCIAGSAIDDTVIHSLSASAEDFVDDASSEQAYLLIRSIIAGHCAKSDLDLFADKLNSLTRLSDPARVSPKMYVSLAILENYLQRYDQALAYIDALLQRSPDSIRGMMMQLYFTSLLGQEVRHETVRQRLRQLGEQGLLNAQQQYNLGLFGGRGEP